MLSPEGTLVEGNGRRLGRVKNLHGFFPSPDGSRGPSSRGPKKLRMLDEPRDVLRRSQNGHRQSASYESSAGFGFHLQSTRKPRKALGPIRVAQRRRSSAVRKSGPAESRAGRAHENDVEFMSPNFVEQP